MGVGAERPTTWGGSSQKLGRIDCVWGGRGADRPGADRLWGGSSVSLEKAVDRLSLLHSRDAPVLLKNSLTMCTLRTSDCSDNPLLG